jgi:hypothetical protein
MNSNGMTATGARAAMEKPHCDGGGPKGRQARTSRPRVSTIVMA